MDVIEHTGFWQRLEFMYDYLEAIGRRMQGAA